MIEILKIGNFKKSIILFLLASRFISSFVLWTLLTREALTTWRIRSSDTERSQTVACLTVFTEASRYLHEHLKHDGKNNPEHHTWAQSPFSRFQGQTLSSCLEFQDQNTVCSSLFRPGCGRWILTRWKSSHRAGGSDPGHSTAVHPRWGSDAPERTTFYVRAFEKLTLRNAEWIMKMFVAGGVNTFQTVFRNLMCTFVFRVNKIIFVLFKLKFSSASLSRGDIVQLFIYKALLVRCILLVMLFVFYSI